MKHKINVTEEDIKYGAPGDCSKCAIALAVQREFPLKNVEVRTVENNDMRTIVTGKPYFISSSVTFILCFII